MSTSFDPYTIPEGKFLASVLVYKRPLGRTHKDSTVLDLTVEPQYKAMHEAGCHFTAELVPFLNGYMVSMTISNEESDIDVEVVPNGPEVQEGLEKMLKRELWKAQPSPESTHEHTKNSQSQTHHPTPTDG